MRNRLACSALLACLMAFLLAEVVEARCSSLRVLMSRFSSLRKLGNPGFYAPQGNAVMHFFPRKSR